MVLLKSKAIGDGDGRKQILLMAEELRRNGNWPKLERRLDRLVGRSIDDVKVNAPFILAMHRQRVQSSRR